MKNKKVKFIFLILLAINAIFAVEILCMQLRWTKQFIELCGTLAIILIAVMCLGLYIIYLYMKGKKRK